LARSYGRCRKLALKVGVHDKVPPLLVADDHTLVTDLCSQLLETEFDVVGTVSNGRDLIRAALQLKPNVIVVDITMPLLNDLDAGEQVKDLLPGVKLIFMTMNSDTDLAAEAFRRGASGYQLKTCAASEMVIAVREVLRGKTYMSQALCKDEVNYLRRRESKLVDKKYCLTGRQREVLQLVAEGKEMKEIADVLNKSTRTVAYHKYRTMEVLSAKSTAELVRYAVRTHIVAA
jgi:DNA-binding NarL/FixJ family response regulator